MSRDFEVCAYLPLTRSLAEILSETFSQSSSSSSVAAWRETAVRARARYQNRAILEIAQKESIEVEVQRSRLY